MIVAFRRKENDSRSLRWTTLPTGVYLRLALMNPLTSRDDLEQLIVAVKAAGIRLTRPKAILHSVHTNAKAPAYVPVRRHQ